MRTGKLWIPVLIGLLCGCDETAEMKASREQAQQKAVEAGQAVGEYTDALKDELYQKHKSELDALDRKMDEYREKAKVASADAKVRMEASLKELESQREQAGKRLDEFAAKGKDAWEEVKTGMARVTEDLKTTFDNASKSFEEPKPSN